MGRRVMGYAAKPKSKALAAMIFSATLPIHKSSY